MEFLYRDKLPNPAVINERIRQFNHIIRGVSQWREPPLDTQWPILVKDNIDVSGLRATAGSYALKELKAEDAFCIKKLREHGGLPFGKTSMSELAGFLSTKMPPGYSELGGQGINPIDPSLTPGGSSSGSCISVAAGFCHAAIGTETHGSIVMPAIACGVVGIKPSVGLVSRDGVIPISHSLDTPGAIAQSVSQAAKLLEAICGTDPNDVATEDCPEKIDFQTDLGEDKSLIRVALLVPAHRAFDAEEKSILNQLIQAAKKQNIVITEIQTKDVETYYKIISSTEIQGDFDRYLQKYGNGKTPGTFKDLVKMYEMRAQHHPYGMDRLTDALKFSSDLNNPTYRNALERGIGNTTRAIDETLKETNAQAIIAVGFVPWWAVARAPYVALPLAQRHNHAMIGITIGCRRLEDRKALDIATRLEKVINEL